MMNGASAHRVRFAVCRGCVCRSEAPSALRAHPRGAARESGGRSRSDSSAHQGTRHCPWARRL
jgi:hypothetical protein